jgi:hypothetical protein
MTETKIPCDVGLTQKNMPWAGFEPVNSANILIKIVSALNHPVTYFKTLWTFLKIYNFPAARNFPLLLEVHHHIHRSRTLVHMQSELKPFQTIIFYYFNIHFNIILPYTQWHPEWTLSLSYFVLNVACTFSSLHSCYKSNSSHPSRCN